MKEHILIIEDDEAILRILRRGLSFESYQVDTAVDGQEGLLKARELHPDLIILDWMLPGMDGSGSMPPIKINRSNSNSNADCERHNS